MQNIVRVLTIIAAMRAKVVGVSGARGAHQLINRQLHSSTVVSSNYCNNRPLLSSNRLAFVSMLSLPCEVQRMNNYIENRRPFSRFHQLQDYVSRRHRSSSQVNDADVGEFFANPETFPDFSSLGITSTALLNRLTSPPNSLQRPSAVQASAYETIINGGNDVIVGAETGESSQIDHI